MQNNKNICLSKLSVLLLSTLLLSACVSVFMKEPAKGLVGNVKVRNVSVESLSATKSPTIAAKVKDAVEKEVAEELKGNVLVDLKITIEAWTGSEHVVGGKVTEKLFGTKTRLSGIVDVLDANSGEVLAKFRNNQEISSGGLLSAQKTINWIDNDNFVIERFATYTADVLE